MPTQNRSVKKRFTLPKSLNVSLNESKEQKKIADTSLNDYKTNTLIAVECLLKHRFYFLSLSLFLEYFQNPLHECFPGTHVTEPGHGLKGHSSLRVFIPLFSNNPPFKKILNPLSPFISSQYYSSKP